MKDCDVRNKPNDFFPSQVGLKQTRTEIVKELWGVAVADLTVLFWEDCGSVWNFDLQLPNRLLCGNLEEKRTEGNSDGGQAWEGSQGGKSSSG